MPTANEAASTDALEAMRRVDEERIRRQGAAGVAQATAQADAVLDRLRDKKALVPAVWRLEVANVLLVAERRDRITEAQATRFLNLLGRLPIRIDNSPDDGIALLTAGRRHDLSAYASSYLLLAARSGAALATLDKKLITAAGRAGVPCFPGCGN